MTIKRGFLALTRSSLLKRGISLTMLIWISLVVVCYVRFLTVPLPLLSEQCSVEDEDFINGSERNLIQHLAEAIRFRTISYGQNNTNLTEIDRFRDFIETSFPRVHSSELVKREIVNGHSLLYTVTGSNPELQPYLLAAHMDVVPANPEEWDHHPFDGVLTNDSLYGRGTLDCKNVLMGIMEALEFALEKNFKPKRTFYMAFGHDEEVSGFQGAAHISALLQSRGVRLEFLLDEGLFVVKDVVPGIKEPVAIVGVAEKGYLTLKLSVSTSGGHSSLAPKETAVVILSKALSKFHSNVHSSQFGKGPEKDMLEEAAPYANGMYRFVYANLWFFSPAISWFFDQNAATSANVRTTTAVTMVGGGLKENVIPTSAWALINHRVFPSQSIQEVIDIDKEIIHDPRIKLETLTAHEASPISSYTDTVFGWSTLKKTIQQIYPKSPVLPGLLPARTDSSWYFNITSVIYRFSPISLHKSNLNWVHGPNEQVRIDNYEQVVNFYYHLIHNSDFESCPNASTEHQEL